MKASSTSEDGVSCCLLACAEGSCKLPCLVGLRADTWAPYPKESRDRREKQFSGYGVSLEHLPCVVVKEPVPVLVRVTCYDGHHAQKHGGEERVYLASTSTP